VIPRVLSVAASDSSGAAGMQADLKTFEARQVYGLSAVTAITAQDSMRIAALQIMKANLVAEQITAVLTDIGADAIKTGLLLKAEIVKTVATAIDEAGWKLPTLVVDPVLVAGDGRCLVDDRAIAAYVEFLFPRALLITPNLDEASILTGLNVNDPESMCEAARQLHELGPRYVLVKGGHLGINERAYDVLYDGTDFHEFRSVRLPVKNARGTGCTFAACITAELAKGHDVPTAAAIAKQYLTTALTAAAGWKMGKGRGTVFHSTGRPPIFNGPVEEE
jgi:hydroxymethylpyrimidine/phosphomethylpyrimidine kinase